MLNLGGQEMKIIIILYCNYIQYVFYKNNN